MTPGAAILALGVLSWILAALITRWTPAPGPPDDRPHTAPAPHRPANPPAPTRGHRTAPHRTGPEHHHTERPHR